MKFKYRIIFFLIGLAGIGLMVWQTDFSNTDWNKLIEPEVLILFAEIIGVWIGIYILHAISYKIIMCEDSKKVHMHSMFRICAAGFALNNVTPAGLVGGEPYRIMALRRYVSTERAAASTLTFSILYAIGHFLLWVSGIIVYMALGFPGDTWVTVLLMVSGGVLLIVVVLFFVFRKIGFAYPVMRFLAKIPLIKRKLAPFVEKKKDSYIAIDDNIREFRRKTWRFISVLTLQYGTRLLEAFEYYLIISYLSTTPVTYFDGLLVMVTASLVGNLLFVIPMQAGSREGGTKIALAFLGIDQGIFGMLAIIYRIRELLFITFGIVLVLMGRKYKKWQPETPIDQNSEIGQELMKDPVVAKIEGSNESEEKKE